MKKKIGITGQSGFLGQHLKNHLTLFPELFEIVDFDNSFFDQSTLLAAFVNKCDVVVHLSAKNRDNDPNVIYRTNVGLVEKLILALERNDRKVHLMFASSSQEEMDNIYGQSKLKGRELLANWATRTNNLFTGLIIPNVFGPFGKPFYNSFIATFCHQLTHNALPMINQDHGVRLIYVDDLVKLISAEILSEMRNDSLVIPHSDERKVSVILEMLTNFHSEYYLRGIIPTLTSKFERDLFNTFRSFIDLESHNPVKYKQNTDNRGSFVEVIRLNSGGQVSFSTTSSGVIRGNHYHTRKVERFSVIKGSALIQLRRIGTKKVNEFWLSGDEPSYIDIPVWYTHNIKNIGENDLYTIFWISEFYDESDADTYFEDV